MGEEGCDGKGDAQSSQYCATREEFQNPVLKVTVAEGFSAN